MVVKYITKGEYKGGRDGTIAETIGLLRMTIPLSPKGDSPLVIFLVEQPMKNRTILLFAFLTASIWQSSGGL